MINNFSRLLAPISALTVAAVIFGTVPGGLVSAEPETPVSPAAPTSSSALPTTVSVGPTTTTTTSTAPETTQPPPVTKVEVRPELRVSAKYDKAAYETWDNVRVTITVVNVGSVAAIEVNAVSSQDPAGSVREYWGSVTGSDERIDPGETVEASHAGPVFWYDVEQGIRTTITLYGRDLGDSLASCVITAPLTPRVRGSIEGVFYGDGNGNHIVDPGEPLGNVTIGLYGRAEFGNHWQVTDDEGRFVFSGIPAGTYEVGADLDGWVVRGTSLTVNGGVNPPIAIRALRPVMETLSVTLRFANDSYSVGETAHLLVTLTNRGSAPLENITAFQYGFDTPEWGDLGYAGPGVTVPPRGSSTFDVGKLVTEDDYNNGEIWVNCIFGLLPAFGAGVAATAAVRVPGGIVHKVRGGLAVMYINFGGVGRPPTYPMPQQEVLLKRRVDGQIVAKAVTDNDGVFEFIDVPAGSYEVTGRWASAYVSTLAYIRATPAEQWIGTFFVYVYGSPPRPNPPTTTSPGPPSTSVPTSPVPQAGIGGKGGLAWTGTNVIWLVIGGLLSIAAGLGLVLRHRQQRF